MACALALAGCDGGEVTRTGTVFPERDNVCASGAAQPCATTTPRRTDAQRTQEEPGGLDNQTLVYVLNTITIPRAQMGRVAGFNLDNLDSGEGFDDAENCQGQQPDYTSNLDPGHIGVDNQFGASVAPLLSGALMTDLDAAVLEQINEGALLLMVEVTGVDNLEYDANIRLQLLLGEVPGGGAPMLTAGGALAPGQTYNVIEMLGPQVQGDIYEGRLAARADAITLSLEIMGMPFSLVISNPQLRFDITSTGLSNGVIGGFITIASIIDTLMSIPSLGEFVGPAQMILGMYADLQPSAANPSRCEAISIGLAFGATTATATR